MRREITKELNRWKSSKTRKVILLRGARQVGKTYIVRELGKSFGSFIELNFEEDKDLASFFDGSINPNEICQKLSAYFATKIVPGETLLFFDEIQVCPNALRALRFFHEKMPQLHVLAAGSLIEFALAEIPSFGVGRISSMFMYPMSFIEFVEATSGGGLCDEIQNADTSKPLNPAIFNKLTKLLRSYLLIGGMPEVVKTYIETNDINSCMEMLDSLILSFRDDFAKYKTRLSPSTLYNGFISCSRQAGRKFKYSNIVSDASSKTYGNVLDLLEQAGLIHRVIHSSSRDIPLGAQLDPRKFKTVVFDIGIHQRILKTNIKEFLLTEDKKLVHSGSLAEVFIGQQLIASGSPMQKTALYYWHREKKGSCAEVDYVLEYEGEVLPVEVKSGVTGQMQSIRIFLTERGLNRGVRTSLENFGEFDSITIIPLFAISKIVE